MAGMAWFRLTLESYYYYYYYYYYYGLLHIFAQVCELQYVYKNVI